jgi:hypothetical protein
LGVTEADIGERRDEAAPNAAGSGRETDASAEGSRPSLPRLALSLGAVAAVAVGLPLLTASHYGAFGIVRNDDWSYLLTLFNWVDTGHLDFNSWVSMTLLAQLALAAPIVIAFGRNVALIQVETVMIGLAGLYVVEWMAFAVTRRLWKATFVAILVAAGPLWGPLAVSFMTDVPAFAVSMLAVALGVRALRDERVSMPYLVGSIAAGLVGFWIRQYAAVPVIAIAIIGGLQLRREGLPRRLRTFAVTLIITVVAAIVFYAFWRTIPHPRAFSPSIPSGHSIKATAYKGTGIVRLVGLLVLPAIVAAGPGRIVTRAWRTAVDTTIFLGLGTAALLAFTASAAPNIAFAGNYVTPNGVLANGVVNGERADIFPAGGFPILLVLGSVGAVLLALALVPLLHEIPGRVAARDWQPREPVTAFLGLVVAGYAVAYFFAAITDIAVYDRYVLPVVPLISVLLLRPGFAATDRVEDAVRQRRRTGRRHAGAFAALALLGVVGFVYTADSAAFDGSRWKTAVDATTAGWTRNQVRGGFEWTNFYAGSREHHGVRYCVRVVLDPPQGIHTPGAIAHEYYRSPLRPAVPVVAIRSRAPCTPGRKLRGQR